MSTIPLHQNCSNSKEHVISEQDKEILKLIDSFFLKSCLLICSKELSSSNTLREYWNLSESWFEIMNNYQIYDLPNNIQTWLHFDGKSVLPPLVIEIYLDLRNLPESFLLRLMDRDGNLWSVCKGTKKTEVVLERWLLELDNTTVDNENITEDGDNLLNNQITLLLRYLHTLIQLLPINSLIKSINNQYLSIGSRIIDGSKPILSRGRIGLSKPILTTYSNKINETNIPAHLEQKKITPIWTKYGLLRVSVSYRKECKFQLQNLFVSEDNELKQNQSQKGKFPTGVSPTLHTISNQELQQSTSISPSIRPIFGVPGTSLEQQQLSTSKKHGGITRQVQPFKVGSLNSLVYEKSTSQIPSRNPSVSSVYANASARRSSIGSNFANNNIISTNAINNNNNNNLLGNHSDSIVSSNFVPRADTGSIESNSKFLSSFSNIRRHSSINRNIENLNSIDRALRLDEGTILKDKGNTKKPNLLDNTFFQNTSHDDLLAFVKLLDSKPEIKIKNKFSNHAEDDNISQSLFRYQNLKVSNNLLSEDLSMSYILSHNRDANKVDNASSLIAEGQERHEGQLQSVSPITKTFSYSMSPYHQDNTKYFNVHQNEFSASAVSSRKNSLNKSQQSILPPIYGGESISYHEVEKTMEPHEMQVSNATTQLQTQEYERGRSQSGVIYKKVDPRLRLNQSPKSLGSLEKSIQLSDSHNRDRLVYNQNYYISQPILMSTPAHAKLHKPSIQSTDILEDEERKIHDMNSSKITRDTHKLKEKRNYLENATSPDMEIDNEVDDEELMFFMSDMNNESDC
ncbi:serine/threonine protein kinase regulatory subunit ATG13 PWA37_004475 [Arxiozyma heterogenica]|uniref:serine/threonine protein kinase regulatory subunit ATG13 n=1 Tax=Arxiozyma heterogenica TaxID=278026 RepID=UPI002EF3CC22